MVSFSLIDCPSYFTVAPDLLSYSQTDFATAQALREGEADNKLWWQGQINEEQQELIEIQDLLRFYRHPQKYFLLDKFIYFLLLRIKLDNAQLP
jgi:exonuclease V gamma subunit